MLQRIHSVSGDAVIPGLSRLAMPDVFLPGFPEGREHDATNEIEFSCLTRNLMVPKTLTSQVLLIRDNVLHL
jgi:hypothetical protein